MKPFALVTGDVVLDSHLYVGVRTAATSSAEPGTTYQEHLGGAALTHKLLEHCSGGAFDVHLAMEAPSPDRIPGQLRSYGVWGERPAKRGSDSRVWRLDRHSGYGPHEWMAEGALFKPRTAASRTEPALTVIDDGGIHFRHKNASDLWPSLAREASSHLLLKMSPPLCRGDLWEQLRAAHAMDRLTVVVSAADLRREDMQVSKRLSWEQCVESTCRSLQSDPLVRQLLDAANVIVNFRSSGALWIADGATARRAIRFVFDHLRLEEEFDRDVDGTVYGFQTCMVAGVAHRLMARHLELTAGTRTTRSRGLFGDPVAMRQTLETGIVAGLTMQRELLSLGHGPVKPIVREQQQPGFPTTTLVERVSKNAGGGFVGVTVPSNVFKGSTDPWTVLSQSELIESPAASLIALAELAARYGVDALSHVPGLRIGKLYTVDRSEIESLRTLEALIRDYENGGAQEKPLCIGVFGPPGSGKSFGVKALAQGILGMKLPPGEKVPILEFNLSQFKDSGDLIGALHRVRDAVLKGATPVAFWDEFDSQRYSWLQYLLAPMQDGAFQEGQVTHPIGKCIFVFAGGTSDTVDQFGFKDPKTLTKQERAALTGQERTQQARDYFEFKRLKGPDFISRLHGFLNVLGVNPSTPPARSDMTVPIRRALVLRQVLKLKDQEELDIDRGLLHALLLTPEYKHGARSLEKIVVALRSGRDRGRILRAALPPDPILQRETNAAEFHKRMEHPSVARFETFPDIETLAAGVHHRFIAGAKKADERAATTNDTAVRWNIVPAVTKGFADLAEDLKASNRAAARRIPELLALINFRVARRGKSDTGSWMQPLKNQLERQLERLAQAEHLGWCAERRASGWSYDAKRDDERRKHSSLVPWSMLGPTERDKDRESVRAIPDLLNAAGFKAVRIPGGGDKAK